MDRIVPTKMLSPCIFLLPLQLLSAVVATEDFRHISYEGKKKTLKKREI